MSGNEILMLQDGGARSEVFALTDEQILGVEEEVAEREGSEGRPEGRPVHGEGNARGDASRQVAADGLREAPAWLAREMKDPWVGDEARELWEGVKRAQREAAEYRELVGAPEDARAWKEIYPGGLAEARSAAERARELVEIDKAFFGAAGRPTEEVRAGRMQLVERLHAQDPEAFREMVEAGARLLRGASGQANAAGADGQDALNLPRSLRSVAGAPNGGAEEKAGHSGRDDRIGVENSALDSRNHGAGTTAQAGVPFGSQDKPVPQEVAARYREFERATNAELERSVGGAIGRAMEAALPNLKWAGNMGADGAGAAGFAPRGEGPFADQGKQASSLQGRMANAVREDVEAALRSDAALGEQVARVLSGRRLDEAARTQVVRLIDARAQQLVPGAVRRVVGSWTAATLGAKKPESVGERELPAAAKSVGERRSVVKNEKSPAREMAPRASRGRVDYRKWSDEEILGM